MDALDFAANTMIKVAGSLSNFFRSAKSDSLTQFTASARVQPVCVVETALVTAPYINDIMQTGNTLIGVYYMQAFAIDNQIGGINVVKRLDKLNPNRSLSDAVLNQPYYSPEDFKVNLPKAVNSRVVSQEAYDTKANGTVNYGRDTVAQLRTADNLAVGKVIEVQVQHGNERATVPVTVSILPVLMEGEMFVTTFGKNGFMNTRKGRWYRYRSGELELLRDMILCRDMIDQHRAALLRDKSGVYAATREKRKNNRLAALASGDPSINTMSNLAVISTDTARSLEQELGGTLKDYSLRQRLFNDSSLMLLFVVDQDREMVQLYYHGIADGSLLSIRDIKSISKGSNTDLTEILRAFQQVSAPAF